MLSKLRWLVPALAFALAFPGVVLGANPAADEKTPSTLEDHAVIVTLSGSDADGDALTFAIGTGPTTGALGSIGTPSCDGLTPSSCTADVTYTPDANTNGQDTFTYTTNDGGADSLPATVTVTVTAVNDEPSFTAGSDQIVAEDSGAASVPSWATGASAGPTDESTQTLNYVVASNTNTALFAAGPAVAANGTLTFTPAANRFGVATVGLLIHDNGGSANGGDDTSPTQSFTITITAVDDPPIAGNDIGLVVPFDAPATALDVLANDTYLPDAPETLAITAVTQGAHGAVVITGGGTGLTYQPVTGFSGTDQFTYTIQDSGGSSTDQATVSLSVGADSIAPVATAPIETIRTGISTSSTVGVRIAWSATDAGVGVARYLLQRSVDGGSYVTVSLPTPLTTGVNQFLVVGHSYQYRMRAYDNNGNFSALKYGPKFLVSRIENTSTKVVYSGAWTTVANVNDSGGSARYTYTANATATMTLSGRDFAIVGPKNSFRGTAWVYVDGVFNASITEKTASSTTLYRQVLWSMHFASFGTHTIRIVVTGSARFDLDCFLALR